MSNDDTTPDVPGDKSESPWGAFDAPSSGAESHEGQAPRVPEAQAMNAPQAQPTTQPLARPAAPTYQAAPAAPAKSGFKQHFGRGFGAGLGVAVGLGIIALIMSIISWLGMVAMIGVVAAGGESNADTRTNSVIWGADNADNTLYAIRINGQIMTESGGSSFSAGVYGYEIARQLDALDAEKYSGVILLMDTPGGTVTGAKAIHDAVERYQARTGHKVMAFVQSMSASGGMYAMANADYIAADDGTMVGSIGVIMGPFEHYKDVTATSGTLLTPGVTTSGGITQEYLTQGKGKDFGNPFREWSDEERDNYTHNIKVSYEQFVKIVSEGRDIPEETIVEELGAYMFDAHTAVDKGLVDEVMGRDAAFTKAAELNGLDPAQTKAVAPAVPSGWASLLGSKITGEPLRVYGHNVPLSTNEGLQPTTDMCVGSTNVLAYAGDLETVCGPR